MKAGVRVARPSLERPRGWLTLEQVAELLGVTARRVRNLIVDGPMFGSWRDGELLVLDEHLALFVGQQRSWW